MKINLTPARLPRLFVIATALALLSACDDSASSQTDRARETQTSSEQAELQKYNAYVQVANSVRRSYAEDLETYQRYIQPVFDGKDFKDNLLFQRPSQFQLMQSQERQDANTLLQNYKASSAAFRQTRPGEAY